MEQHQRQNIFKRGELFLFRGDKEFRFSAKTTDEIIVNFPTEHLEGNQKDAIKRQAGKAFPPTSLTRSVAVFLRTLQTSMTTQPTDGNDHAALGTLLVDLTRSVLSEASGQQRLVEDIERYEKELILQTIHSRYQNPRLSPEEVASTVGISVRSLYRRFQEQEISFRSYLENLRVDHAEKMFSQYHFDFGHVALRSGFGTTTKMRRAFQRRHGMSPQEYLSTMHHQQSSL